MELISKPEKAWNRLAGEEADQERFLSRYLFPLIGMLTLAAFVGVFFADRVFSIEKALRLAIKALLSSLCSFYLGAYILDRLLSGPFGGKSDLPLCQRFMGYASSLVYVLMIVLGLLPSGDFFFLYIFVLYTPFIVYAGAGTYMGIDETPWKWNWTRRTAFTIATSALIIFLPGLIDKFLYFLMPGFRV